MTHNLDATVFVYKEKKTSEIRCEYFDKARYLENAENWEHIATLEPRMWIQCHWMEVERNKDDFK